MKFENIKLVQFDLDGTLIDIKKILDNNNIQVIKELTGKTLTLEEFQSMDDSGISQEALYKKFGIDDWHKAWMRFSYLEETCSGYTVHDGVFEILDYLKSKNIIIHLTTRHERMNIVDNKMENTGLGKYFTHDNTTVTHVDKYKDILDVCKRYTVNPKETIFVSDTAFDMAQGKKAGVHTIAKSGISSFSSEEDLRKANPDKLIYSIREIKEII